MPLLLQLIPKPLLFPAAHLYAASQRAAYEPLFFNAILFIHRNTQSYSQRSAFFCHDRWQAIVKTAAWKLLSVARKKAGVEPLARGIIRKS